MAETNQDVSLHRGDTHTLVFTLTNALGEPYDPTVPGVEVRWRLLRSASDNDARALVVKDLSAGITAVPGEATVELAAEDTDWVPGIYAHELKVFDGEETFTAAQGVLWIRPSARMGTGEEPILLSASLTGGTPTVATSG